MQTEGPRWECIYCGSVMDKTNFADFIKQSDDDKNSVREARVQYHIWRRLTDQIGTQAYVNSREYMTQIIYRTGSNKYHTKIILFEKFVQR